MVVADALNTLSSVLRSETRLLHREAERTGIIADLLRGRVSRRRYALFLRNLHPAYERLEEELDRHRHHPALGPLARREVYRASALAADLASLAGEGWAEALPLTLAGREYAHQIAAAADGSGDRLVGHVYVRYFGDLNGGQILKRRLETSADLPSRSLSFYDFPDIDDMPAFLKAYRGSLDTSARWIVDRNEVVESARHAFFLNIQLSQAVQNAAIESGPEPL